ncbi:MAG: NusG domain II-containing protein, partial [Lachnospiraceae bacterium]|nr:NusG domain II-containing protein [Lachnospiraceae bacterium]
MHNNNPNIKKCRLYAAVIGGLIAFLALASIIYIICGIGSSDSVQLTADIYKDGVLIKSLELSSCGNQTFSITDDNGCYNIVEVRDGRIGITSASCPDKLCVHQGFVDSCVLPITCLPNNVVILLQD